MGSNRSLVGEPIQDKNALSDLILWEVNKDYCRHSINLPAGTYEIGELVNGATKSEEALLNAFPAFTDALICERIVVPDGETWAIPALARGPAIVNMDAVVKASPSETDAALITRCADMVAQGVRFVRIPVHRTVSGVV